MDLTAFIISLTITLYCLLGRGMVLYYRYFEGVPHNTSAMFYLPLMRFVNLCELAIRGEDWVVENLDKLEDDEDNE